MKTINFNKILSGLGAWLKERVRKFFVALKKNPQAIPLVALCTAFVYYSLNMTTISNTTAKIPGLNLGLMQFISMLLMLLSFVCMLSAFPKRQKPNLPMNLLLRALYTIVIVADHIYITGINQATTRTLNPIAITKETAYIATARDVLEVHIILIAITLFCVIFEPIFAALLKKINTSIEIEEGERIESIDISEDD